MNGRLARLKQDLNTIEIAVGLDIWTRRDIRRGFLGVLGGMGASMFLAVWMFVGYLPELGMLLFLVLLQAVVILKAVGYRANPSPSAGTQREVGFYNRYYFSGTAVIVAYYFWAQHLGIDPVVLFASIVVITGMWYLFYAISSPSRSLSVIGAASLLVGGFVLPEAKDLPQAFCWFGLIATLGCAFEAALLFVAWRQKGGSAETPAVPVSPPGTPKDPAHAAH
ncbi:MAG TPA: hypothetical protein VLT36_00150 [Candidatus Dormibacteraeota bacterium]|nr:hypothetical protein [Candidatus Dormibacteraeota bacterium]